MLSEIVRNLRHWSQWDTAITFTAACAAMSCALPGTWLVLRRQSMLADALAHAALPGVVGAFLATYGMQGMGWISEESLPAVQHLAVVLGAVLAGLATAWLTETVQRLGRIDSGAALGVVFTCLFAIGLILIRLFADNVHLDPDCVLFGVLEASALDTIHPDSWIPRAAVANAVAFLVNGVLITVFFKELRIAAFDPSLARTQGIPAGAMHYTLLAATAVSAATAFSTVGSILVIGLLIVPAATAQLLTQRLWVMVVLSAVLAAVFAIAGHAVAMSVPGPVFNALGYPQVRDAGTAGTIAVVGGMVFATIVLVAPRSGLATQAFDRFRMALDFAADDVLGGLYRREESSDAAAAQGLVVSSSPWMGDFARRRLARRGHITKNAAGIFQLTESGRVAAKALVRSHRLWESYLDQNFPLPPDQLHLAADRAEHYLDPELREALAAEVPAVQLDPHGREIPGENGS
jgi:manganese/zinc/iron transport system permease protein